MIIPDVHGESSSLIRSIFANAFYVFGSQPKTCVSSIYPIGPMYGIYANIWGILMVNVTIYRIHGSYGDRRLGNLEMFQDWMRRKNFGYLVEFAGKCPSFIKVYWSWESTFNMRVFVG